MKRYLYNPSTAARMQYYASLSKGKNTLVLLPEISQINHAGSYFPSATALHSDLTLKRQKEVRSAIRRGETPLVLGTRMALFAPFPRLNLIIVDEEQDSAYKSEKSPRYHARETAEFLADLYGADLVLGSSCPAIETYYKVESGEYQTIELTAEKQPIILAVVDARGEYALISPRLQEEMSKTLGKGGKIFLLSDRHGYFTYVVCRECGQTVECPNCSVSLIYDSNEKKLACRYCGFSSGLSLVCSRCHGSVLKYSGGGQQRVEDEVKKLFPTGGEAIKVGSRWEEADLVGVIALDPILRRPDFRAAEQAFQILTEARKAAREKVVVQTSLPEHYAIAAAVQQDYTSFYRQEVKLRQELSYPPFSKLISLMVAGKTEPLASSVAEAIEKELKTKVKVLGPVLASVAKKRGLWRYQLLLKGKDLDLMRQAVKETLSLVAIPREVKLTVDIEPV